MEVAQYGGRIASVLWGDSFSTVEVVQYSTVGDNISTCEGITAVHVGDSFSTVGGYLQYSGGCSEQWGDNISTVGDNISTMGG